MPAAVEGLPRSTLFGGCGGSQERIACGLLPREEVCGYCAVMDPAVVWTAVSSVAGVAAVAVAGWQVRIGIADHRLREAAARRSAITDSTPYTQRSPEPAGTPVRLAPRPQTLAGREDLLAGLQTRLSEGPRPRTVALCGLGGVGKTSVAVEYAHRHLNEVGTCWQFPAEDPLLMEAEFAVLAEQLNGGPVGVQDPVAAVHAMLARQEANWLLIFDNVLEAASVGRFLPPSGPGQVLVTTQSQYWPPAQFLEVPVLETGAAVEFLASRTGSANRAAAADLARELGGLPLALEQAAAYMQVTGVSMEAYLRLFRARQSDLLVRGEVPGHPDHVAATLGLALSELEGHTRLALELLRLLAFLAPEPVPLGLLFAGVPGTAVAGAENVSEQIAPLLTDPVAAGDAIAALRRYSLVTPAGDGAVLVHRLVSAVTRAALSEEEAARWKRVTAELVDRAIPVDTEAPAAWPAYAALVPHGRVILGLTSVGMARIAEYLKASGSYYASLELWQQITDAYAEGRDHRPESPDALQAFDSLAGITGRAGSAERARDQYAAVLPAMERVLGPEHPEALLARGNLAHAIAWIGDFDRAREQYAALVPDMERVQGAEHPDTLRTRRDLAFIIGEGGDCESGRDMCADVLPVMERALGPEDPETLWARSNLAVLTAGSGDISSARDQGRALFPAVERVQGPEHFDTLRVRNNIALFTGLSGEFDDARDQLADLVPCYSRVLGAEHPITFIVRDSLAVMVGLAGDPERARAECADLLAALERTAGPDYIDTRVVRSNLAVWTEADDGRTRRIGAAFFSTIHARVTW